MLQEGLYHFNDNQLKTIFRIVGLFYILSFFLPSVGAQNGDILGFSSDNSNDLLFGYQCFVFSYTMIIASLYKGAMISFCGLLIGCFANTYLFVLALIYYFEKGKQKSFLAYTFKLFLSIISVIYWSSWGIAYNDIELKLGYYLWAVTTCLLTLICITRLRLCHME
ncbi:MAG: hypothetical protein MK207_15465 [Saprospiraceae bacterium]|nr:hypothetical protein [Saprospiraceae bacterium]